MLTAKDKTEKELFLNKSEQIIFENFPGGIIIFDCDGNISSANDIYKDFFHVADGVSIFDQEFYVEKNLVNDYKKLLTDGVALRRDYCRALTHTGETKYLKVIAFPLKNSEKIIVGGISLFIDTTESHVFRNKLIELNTDIEEIIKHRTDELDRVNEELKEVIESKSIFMADVSHEFRTSLTIMQCSLELLSKQSEIKMENLELFTNVITEIKRVSNTLADLALLNRTDFSNLRSHHKMIDIHSVVVSICKELRVVASESNIKIKFDENSKPLEMMGDKEQLEKLLLNLVRNGIKYNKDGGWVRVSTKSTKAGVFIVVEDNGVGIPKKEISRIFDRFYRVDKSRSRSGGSGLGLAICKHIMEDIYGGKITVKSKVGEGSTFTAFFPKN